LNQDERLCTPLRNHSAIGPVFLLADLSQGKCAVKENPKHDGLGTISMLGAKTAFVGLGGRGSCLVWTEACAGCACHRGCALRLQYAGRALASFHLGRLDAPNQSSRLEFQMECSPALNSTEGRRPVRAILVGVSFWVVRATFGLAGCSEGPILNFMGKDYTGGVCIVAASKDGYTEYWAASTPANEAVPAVLRALPHGWTAKITNRRITPARIAALNLRPNSVCRLQSHE
jgi:hypothetical protein